MSSWPRGIRGRRQGAHVAIGPARDQFVAYTDTPNIYEPVAQQHQSDHCLRVMEVSPMIYPNMSASFSLEPNRLGTDEYTFEGVAQQPLYWMNQHAISPVITQAQQVMTPLPVTTYTASTRHAFPISVINTTSASSFQQRITLDDNAHESKQFVLYSHPEAKSNTTIYEDYDESDITGSPQSASPDSSAYSTSYLATPCSSGSNSGPTASLGGEKKYKCNICGKYFRRDLPRHIRTHQKTARFVCPFPRATCPHKRGQFNRPYDFKKHLLHGHFVFDDQKTVRSFRDLCSKLSYPGTCMCGMRFVAKDWLDSHVLNANTHCPCLERHMSDNLDKRTLKCYNDTMR
jgi:DNA-directed RNA polymerase subunit RPC12/RpoP